MADVSVTVPEGLVASLLTDIEFYLAADPMDDEGWLEMGEALERIQANLRTLSERAAAT